MRNESVQALDPPWHSPRAACPVRERLDPGTAGCLSAPGQVVAMSREVSLPQVRVARQPPGHLPHRPARFQPTHSRARARAGQVVQGRERRPVWQPWRRLDDVGQTARAAVRDRTDPARRTTQLQRDRRYVSGYRHLSGRRHLSGNRHLSGRRHVIRRHLSSYRRVSGLQLTGDLRSAGCLRFTGNPRLARDLRSAEGPRLARCLLWVRDLRPASHLRTGTGGQCPGSLSACCTDDHSR